MFANNRTLPESIPPYFGGMIYQDVLAQLSRKRRIRTYLEIGVQAGLVLEKIAARHAVAVDPQFTLTANVAREKHRVSLVQCTSDEFFADTDARAIIGSDLDLVFLDGFHNFEFLLRDLMNTEALSHRSTLVALHDCLPLNEFMIDRNEIAAVERGQSSSYPNAWTGDVWKVIPILQKYRPDLNLICVDAAPTGLVFVTNLSSASTTLRDNYLDIVAAFINLENSRGAIQDLYRSIKIISTNEILNSFDHSLFFTT